jgi:hypothetical protein
MTTATGCRLAATAAADSRRNVRNADIARAEATHVGCGCAWTEPCERLARRRGRGVGGRLLRPRQAVLYDD